MIFRYKYPTELKDLLKHFAEKNITKTTKEQKQEWKQFIKQHNELIKLENEKQQNEEYTTKHNDKTMETLEDQLWKSVKYYYMKKMKKETTTNNTPDDDTASDDTTPANESPEPTKKHRLTKGFLKTITDHITQETDEQPNSSPDKLYKHFLETNKDALAKEIEYYIEAHQSNQQKDEIKTILITKIKKTYKNKLYNIQSKSK
jgi:hypothetical protein